jgi:hypothetical protein
MWIGLLMGYAYHFGFFARIDMGANKATMLESRFPFNRFQERPYFITAGNACGGEILPSFMNRAGSSAREAPAEESKSGSAAAAGNNSAAAGFKAFAGKGKSIGGAPINAAPRYDS